MGIPHFGLLANRSKKQALAQCRKLLELHPGLPDVPIKSAHDVLLELTGIDLSRCPRCQTLPAPTLLSLANELLPSALSLSL